MKPPYLHSALLTSLVVVQVSTNTANGSDCPGEFWADLPPGQPGLDGGLLEKARDYALTGGGSGIVIHRGKAVMRWEDQRRTYDLKSTSKSIGGTVLGLAMKDGFVRLDDKAAEIHPEFAPPPVPAPPSPVIKTIRWAPKESIIRLAKGSDNWPITWADDGHLYTADGDGWGFRPKVKNKLSLGLARVEGMPPNIKGVNIRSATGEATGDGKRGRKASGVLMIDGILYMCVRNAGNSQLGWSLDRGTSWIWANWRFTESFGCPTFLNCDRNHAGARDDYVYVYSQDTDSACERADQFVLARARRKHLRDRSRYSFFAGIREGQPVWSGRLGDRAAVSTNPSRCYRSSVS